MWKDRETAGKELAKQLEKFKSKSTIVLGIPRGGVIVAAPVAKALSAKLDVVVVRKLPIPDEPEAGFGAIATDGSTVMNNVLVKQLGLTKEQIAEVKSGVLAEVRRRESVFRAVKPAVPLKGKTAIIVDDGLATGYTAIAAIKAIKKKKPKQVIVAVPTASASALAIVRKHAQVIAMAVSHLPIFAVADSYESFPELTDDEIIGALKKGIKYNE
jgi:putative phosphoribosyl transferase